MADQPETFPVRAGDWLVQGREIAHVKHVWRSDNAVLVDLVLYAPDGERIGRNSPSEGGPRTYEPAVPLDGWQRVKKPHFPLRLRWLVDDEQPGRLIAGYEFNRLPWGEFRHRQARATATRETDLDPLLEVHAARRAAQELRDVAKHTPEAAKTLRERAKLLEEAADRLARSL